MLNLYLPSGSLKAQIKKWLCYLLGIRSYLRLCCEVIPREVLSATAELNFAPDLLLFILVPCTSRMLVHGSSVFLKIVVVTGK